jgi:hypothetical protein
VADDKHPRPDPNAGQSVDAGAALERLGRLSLRELSMDSLLQTVADLTKIVMPGNPETSVTLLVKDNPTTVVHPGQLAVDLDETQYAAGHGPCLHAARTGQQIEITDTRAETRWPDYVRHAAERSNLSSLSIPLLIDEDAQVGGALNIYARQPDAFDEDSPGGRRPVRPPRPGRGQQPLRLPECPGHGRQPAGRAGVPRGHRPGQRSAGRTVSLDARPSLPVAGPGVDERQPQAA